ncbi:uncharacterized protein LOC133927974 [Phragmites australis]|uniref:uncharacterized protein LOC133927974 n=1 Tax=Phragmites australis TaxID=29695 RepID=UPI002D785D67|nr:uncharacterized protein LOC133927974 [Phragmites australis]
MEAAEVAAVVGKVAERLDAEDYDDHEGITEESVAEVMSWLELEINLAAGAAVLALPPLAAAGGCVTVSGNKESCGSSLSRPASTVMATVDGRAGAPAPPAVPWPFPEAAAVVGDKIRPKYLGSV